MCLVLASCCLTESIRQLLLVKLARRREERYKGS